MATETEIKLLLPDEASFAQVRAALQQLVAPKVADQTNVYLDTSGRDLLRQRAMARVRRFAGSAQVLFTCKTSPRLENGVMRVEELERELDPAAAAPWRSSAPPARVQVRDVDRLGWLQSQTLLAVPLAADTWLHAIGALQTLRRKFALNVRQLEPRGPSLDIVLELDHARYSQGPQRFEIEVETPEPELVGPALEHWLNGLGIGFEPAAESKYAQFLRLSRDVGGWHEKE
jgi:uncharacterized protein YjbK